MVDEYICSDCGTSYNYNKKRRELGDVYWLERVCSEKCYIQYIKNIRKRQKKVFVNPITKETHETLV